MRNAIIVGSLLVIIAILAITLAYVTTLYMTPQYNQCEILNAHYSGFSSAANIHNLIVKACK